LPDFAKQPGTYPVRDLIRLIVADIDGCLSPGSGAPFDHRLLDKLTELNHHSRTDSSIPAVTVCTGRPEPYVECLLQVIHGYLPAMCEGGTVFFDPATHGIIMHPDFGKKEKQQLAELRARVEKEMVGPHAQLEPGKISHITLITYPPKSPKDYLPIANKIAADFGDTFVVELSQRCVHILFRNIHKGTGVTWLAERTGISLGQMAAIGDAIPDLPFLETVGASYAPANAQDPVKDLCQFVSRNEDHFAALDMIESVLEHNRRVCEQEPKSTLEQAHS
jgi:hydroxymethylpyrimidine pyrophosphatase-like HAD family hydrolase